MSRCGGIRQSMIRNRTGQKGSGGETKKERQMCRSFLDRFKPKLEALVEIEGLVRSKATE